MSKSESFVEATRKHGLSGQPTQEQFDRLYDDLETKLFEAVADFGVDELNQILDAARAIRANRPS